MKMKLFAWIVLALFAACPFVRAEHDELIPPTEVYGVADDVDQDVPTE
jgi:hypothetical protein